MHESHISPCRLDNAAEDCEQSVCQRLPRLRSRRLVRCHYTCIYMHYIMVWVGILQHITGLQNYPYHNPGCVSPPLSSVPSLHGADHRMLYRSRPSSERCLYRAIPDA